MVTLGGREGGGKVRGSSGQGNVISHSWPLSPMAMAVSWLAVSGAGSGRG